MKACKSMLEVFDHDDVMCEILIRLPPESVSRLILVSKRWLQFICSTTFQTYYLSRWPERFHLLGFFLSNTQYIRGHGERVQRPRSEPALPLLSTSVEGDDLEYSGILNQLGYFIDASNGLLLCGRHPKTYFVWNPITKERHKLPHPRVHFESLCMAFLVEDYIENLCYKVIRAKCDYNLDESLGIPIETFNSKTRTWNYSTLKCSSNCTLCPLTAGTVIKGVVHWYAELGHLAIYDAAHGDRLLHLTRLPGSCDYDERTLGESVDGLLQYGFSNSFGVEIWVLTKEEANSSTVSSSNNHLNRKWNQRYSVNFKLMWKMNPNLKRNKDTQLLAFLPRNSESIFIRSGTDIYIYHRHSKKLEMVYQHRRGASISWDINSVVPYFQPSWPHSRFRWSWAPWSTL